MMFRSALVRSLRASAPRAIRVPVSRPITTPRAVRPAQFVPGFQSMTARFYSAPAGLSKEEVEGRIINLLKNFDKVRIFSTFSLSRQILIFDSTAGQ